MLTKRSIPDLIQRNEKNKDTRLVIQGMELSVVPESISNLTHLRRLDLRDNKLVSLPKSLAGLSQLRELILTRNRFVQLPRIINRFDQLVTLSVMNNRLAELPEWIGCFTKLKYLHLSMNLLTEVPDSIGSLKDVQHLCLYDNQLKRIPDSIGEMTNLRHLRLFRNQLHALPESIGNLNRLERIELRLNVLKKLPKSLANLNQLKELDLSDNRLAELPEFLKDMSSLKALYLHGNLELGLPEEVLGPRWQDVRAGKVNATNPAEILQYYFRVRSSRRPLNEAKLILVGRGGVGKTSLVNKLVHDKFKNEKKTQGINITKWKVQLNKGDDVRLNIWDFGGQEIMHATHQFFLTQRSLYLLVLNGREGGEDADAEYWLKLIESFGGDSPVITVLNKITEHPFDVNRRALKLKYPFIRDFVRTDCKDNEGLNKLRKTIEQETSRLKHLRDAFPANWFTIKDRLAGMRKNFLSFEEYRKICSRLGEKNIDAQESLAFYLHSLGVALNYKDDPRLQDTHCTKPTLGHQRNLQDTQL